MTSALPKPAPDDPAPDWSEFYKSFQKPGYIHGFEIGHKLGGGVFGVVYKARRESIGKAYAIKFLKVEDPGVRRQVLSELDTVRLFAQVDHPNLVSIEDRGITDGIPYIVMGYAGDETLKSRLEERTFDEREALQVFGQIARGVHALHEHSLVHFDLKPANIFLKGDVARVGDYGLSKLITETAMSLSTGRGTPYYMAPEMLRRRGDHRSDVYSLGVILYECLVGDVPFTGQSEWEVLKGHEEKPVVFPDRLATHHRALLERMLAKDPEERYQSLAEVLQDLHAPVRLGESIVLGSPRSGSPPEDPPTVPEASTTRKGVIQSTGGLLQRWWPWLLVWAGTTMVILQSFPPRLLDLALGIVLVNGGLLILMARALRWIGGGRRQQRPGWFVRWCPWLLLLLGNVEILLSAFPRHAKGWAVAIVLLQIGVLALVARGVRAIVRRRRRRRV